MSEVKHDENQRRIDACLNAFEGIPTDRIEGKDIGQIIAGELKLHHAGPRHDGGFGFEFSGGACQLLAEAYAEQFRESGAINYLELLFEHSEIGPLTITMQRVEGLTPAQKLAKAEAERDALAANISDCLGQLAGAMLNRTLDSGSKQAVAYAECADMVAKFAANLRKENANG